MTPKKFEEIAENIKDIGDGWISYVTNQKNVGSLEWAKGWQFAIRDSYETTFKPSLKFMSVDDDRGFLDRHKIAAALFLAVIQKQPLISKFGEKDCLTVRDANMLLAVEAGGLILFAFGLTEATLTTNPTLKKIYDPEQGFVFPPPCNGNRTYPEHFANTLRLINQQAQPFLMSHIFFLLQRHFEAWRALELDIQALDELDHEARRKAIEPYLADVLRSRQK
jgi:hypothetical protein